MCSFGFITLLLPRSPTDVEVRYVGRAGPVFLWLGLSPSEPALWAVTWASVSQVCRPPPLVCNGRAGCSLSAMTLRLWWNNSPWGQALPRTGSSGGFTMADFPLFLLKAHLMFIVRTRWGPGDKTQKFGVPWSFCLSDLWTPSLHQFINYSLSFPPPVPAPGRVPLPSFCSAESRFPVSTCLSPSWGHRFSLNGSKNSCWFSGSQLFSSCGDGSDDV